MNDDLDEWDDDLDDSRRGDESLTFRTVNQGVDWRIEEWAANSLESAVL